MARVGGLVARLRVPVMLAPMAGVSSPRLVAAAAASGVLGMHGAAFRTPAQLAADVDEVRARTDRAFGVNLFAGVRWDADAAAPRLAAARQRVEPHYRAAGMLPPQELEPPAASLEALLEVVLDKAVPVFSFCFGALDPAVVRDVQRRGTLVIGTATSVEEAVVLQESGVDAIVAQGGDAGGHRGSFLPSATLVGTLSLVPQVVDQVVVPVIAAGGIMDGRGVAAARCLGAVGAALGTAFLTSSDSDASALHKQRVLAARETDTVVTAVFSGRPARGLHNRFVADYDAPCQHHILDQDPRIAPYPMQQSLTNPLKKATLAAGDASVASMWCGQAPRLATEDSVEQIVARIEHDLATISAVI